MSRLSLRITLGILGALAAIAVIAVTLHAAIIQPGKASVGGNFAGELARSQELVIYCGRADSLVGEIIERFRRDTGVNVKVKYGNTGHLAALILEEGRRSPADLFFAQDPGGLGLLSERGLLRKLPHEQLDLVGYVHRDGQGRWIGVTGRLRTLSYSTQRVAADDLPQSLIELTHPRWRGRIGWAPSNASFQALVTAMRHELGEAATGQWLRAMIANGVRIYPRNTPIIQAIADGEIDLGLVNHYYLHRFLAERGEAFPVANHVPAGTNGEGDLGGTMLISGVGVLNTARNVDAAHRFIDYLLSSEGQRYFVEQTFEYPLAAGMSAHEDVPALDGVRCFHSNLADLADLEATVALLRTVGALR